MHRTMYKFVNKVSKPLAMSLRIKPRCTYISKLLYPQRGLVYSSEDIARTFQEYYKTLYTVSNPLTVPTNTQGHENMAQYMLNTALPRIDQDTVDSLNTPFTIEEIF